MFLGHIAVGLAGKRVAPRAPLALLVLAPIFVDGIWPLFLLAGLERVHVEPGNTAVTPLSFVSYPWTHSLLMGIVWAMLFAWLYRRRGGDLRASIWLALAVLSHWFLDLVVHRPDLPLVPGGGPKLGLGIWNHVPLTLAVEVGLLLAGTLVYLRVARPRGARGLLALGSFLVFLLVVYASVVAGPPPPNSLAVAISALALWILVPWAAWIDRTSVPRAGSRREVA